MSFAAKTDWVGLSQTGLVLRSNSQNATNTVLEIPGADGSILGDLITGHVKAPTCEYALSGTVNLANIVLGKCYNEPYALSRIRLSTSAGGEPTFSAEAVQIEPGAE